METLHQTATPLSRKFFCNANVHLVNRAIRHTFKQKTNISIDYQNPNDLIAIMRSVYVMNESDHHNNIDEQIRKMNMITVETCMKQINTSLSQFYAYKNQLGKPVLPPAIPQNTSLYGDKIGYNTQIGL